MSKSTEATTTANFKSDVLESDTTVLVDFWATWCGPCRAVAPILEEIAAENTGKLKVVKVDIDQNPELAQEYKIMGVPTLAVFKKGQMVGSIVGARPKNGIMQEVEPHM